MNQEKRFDGGKESKLVKSAVKLKSSKTPKLSGEERKNRLPDPLAMLAKNAQKP